MEQINALQNPLPAFLPMPIAPFALTSLYEAQ